jgi:hypothetical protein
MSVRIIIAAIFAAGAASAAPATPQPMGAATAPPSAVRLVKGLYAHEAAPTRVAGVFARDLARAFRKDISHKGEVGEIDFDWRYGAQDEEITELKVEAVRLKPGAMPMADRGEVRATFKNFGRPHEVLYRVCKSPEGGWRISDVSSVGEKADDTWDLRQLLKLDPDKVRC